MLSQFVVAFLIFYYYARALSQEDNRHQAEAALSNMVLRIDEVLKSVEVVVSDSSWMMEEYRNDSEKGDGDNRTVRFIC